MLHEFDFGIVWPMPPRDVKAVSVEKLDESKLVDEGDAVPEGWVRGERGDEDFDLDLDG